MIDPSKMSRDEFVDLVGKMLSARARDLLPLIRKALVAVSPRYAEFDVALIIYNKGPAVGVALSGDEHRLDALMRDFVEQGGIANAKAVDP